MAGEWREAALGDVIELKRGYDLPRQARSPGVVPIVSSSGVSGYHSEAKVSAPGVVTGKYGTLGEVFYVSEDFWPLNTTLYVRDFKGNDPRFVGYFLRSIDFLAYSDKAAVPGVNRNHLHQARVFYPGDPAEQHQIASILGSLDDKIELNRRMNETLEALARVLFKSWFVDFDPVRAKMEGRQPAGMDDETAALFPDSFEDSPLGEIPKGWSVEPLDQIAYFLNGLALQKYPPEGEESLPAIKITELRKGVTESSGRASTEIPSQYIVEDGDVLFSWSGSLEVQLWTGGRGALNQHLFKVTSDRYPKWFYYYWIKQHLTEFRAIAADKATTMGHIKRHHLTDTLTVVPPEPTLNAMSAMMEPIVNKMLNNTLEASTLATIRDALLPKLLSGEVRVGQAEEIVEGAV